MSKSVPTSTPASKVSVKTSSSSTPAVGKMKDSHPGHAQSKQISGKIASDSGHPMDCPDATDNY